MTSHDDLDRWTTYWSDFGPARAPAPVLTEGARREVARFEALDGTPLIRLTDRPIVPFGYQSARQEESTP